jgi:hypothetical protein
MGTGQKKLLTARYDPKRKGKFKRVAPYSDAM